MSAIKTETTATTGRAILIRLDQVKARTCLSRSTIYAYMREGRFPEPIALSDRRVAWIEGEIDAWIAGRIASHRSA
ncbi:AlpA family transcriptional regulator [Ancylobacter aquaticus]|uniref:AlpA family transcriptional regulator n=1 Tax=Ancylobacter aquaticus TaxID=100 RepID=A0A4V2PK30_ANCAQ|nr:AlpA family transcriptional regulator [Ancylobacter aquaticus]TCK30766.1 AlpA family transcriptional regulator [Ancylobacter aquaticus]